MTGEGLGGSGASVMASSLIGRGEAKPDGLPKPCQVEVLINQEEHLLPLPEGVLGHKQNDAHFWFCLNEYSKRDIQTASTK